MLRIALSSLRWAALAALMVNVATAQIPTLTPTQVIPDPVSDPFDPLGYGCSAALDGDTAVVHVLNLPGALVYQQDASSGLWTQRQQIRFDVSPIFCRADHIALREDTLLVALGGPVLVYEDDGAGFTLQTSFTPADGTVLEPEVYFDRNTAAASGDGAAFVFVRSGDDWTEQAEVRPSDGAAGEAIALNRNTLLVSALDRTAVYVFVRRGTDWIEQQKLEPQGEVIQNNRRSFGSSAAVDNNVAVIGAVADAEIIAFPDLGIPAGAAFVFVRHGHTWTQQQKLLPPDDPFEYFGFGRNIEVDGGLIVISAPDFCGPECRTSGKISGFVRKGTTWTEAFRAAGTEIFGVGLSLRNGELLAAGPGDRRFSSGEARFYDVRPLPQGIPDPDAEATTAR